jgi:hypothetical protein
MSAIGRALVAGRPWFSDRAIGTLFLLPITLWGWLALATFIVIVAATVVSNSELMWPIRMIACVAYLALSYLKSDRGSRF